MLPNFSWKDKKGNIHGSSVFLGKPLILVFFASSCKYCKFNFSFLSRQVISDYKGEIEVVGIGRGCSEVEVELYHSDNDLNFPLIADPTKEIYSMFASKIVPRNYLFNASGALTFSIRGYKPEQILLMKKRI
ncbi:MAG: TlpA family protein disulfide reductase [Bacteroidales bacterium]|nr:TlpA family protein disulfide reductase [Bacteroidales bacterium]MCB9013891.1 TlpA family protein disulfide reductase [Bacteroidales bacterium]